MSSLTYIPDSATLVILFKVARARLMASSYGVASLTDSQLISITEDMNSISDAIREAVNQVARKDSSRLGRTRSSDAAEVPVADLTSWAQLAASADRAHLIDTGEHVVEVLEGP